MFNNYRITNLINCWTPAFCLGGEICKYGRHYLTANRFDILQSGAAARVGF
jgi:hypothetical protein